jgi:unsaturated rhamnogalacturonyl hydrolase
MLWMLIACSGGAPDPGDGSADAVAVAERLAEEGMFRWEAESLPFAWMQTVWVWGLHQLVAQTGHPEAHSYSLEWLDANVGRYLGDDPDTFESSDSLSPSILATTWMQDDDHTDYEPITEEAWRYLFDDAVRTSIGAWGHWGPDHGFEHAEQNWVDSLFMYGQFLVREHVRTESETALIELELQIPAFSTALQDSSTGFFWHAWDDLAGTQVPQEETFWTRGNSWVLVTTGEILSRWGSEHRTGAVILPIYVSLAEAFEATQDPDDGLWHTVANEPHGSDVLNYTETSGSALVAWGLIQGLRAGVLDSERYEPVVERALAGVLDRIEEREGELVVWGSSLGTNPGDYDHYVSIDTMDNLILGNGAVIALLAEASNYGIQEPL